MSRIPFFSDLPGAFPAMKALRARVEADAPDLVRFQGGSKASCALLDDRILAIRRLADGAVSRVANLS